MPKATQLVYGRSRTRTKKSDSEPTGLCTRSSPGVWGRWDGRRGWQHLRPCSALAGAGGRWQINDDAGHRPLGAQHCYCPEGPGSGSGSAEHFQASKGPCKGAAGQRPGRTEPISGGAAGTLLSPSGGITTLAKLDNSKLQSTHGL